MTPSYSGAGHAKAVVGFQSLVVSNLWKMSRSSPQVGESSLPLEARRGGAQRVRPAADGTFGDSTQGRSRFLVPGTLRVENRFRLALRQIRSSLATASSASISRRQARPQLVVHALVYSANAAGGAAFHGEGVAKIMGQSVGAGSRRAAPGGRPPIVFRGLVWVIPSAHCRGLRGCRTRNSNSHSKLETRRPRSILLVGIAAPSHRHPNPSPDPGTAANADCFTPISLIGGRQLTGGPRLPRRTDSTSTTRTRSRDGRPAMTEDHPQWPSGPLLRPRARAAGD